MDALFWSSLGLLLAAIVGGLTFCAVTGLRSWRVFRSSGVALTHALEGLAVSAEKTAARAEALASRSHDVLPKVARLRVTIARARVLSAAFGEVTSLWAAVRRLVPVK
jgi:hypothetical protein